MATKNTTPEPRYRNFATVVYPESAPENWREILDEYKIPCFISPLHDADLNPTGEKKKPHFHVLVPFDGKKSRVQVQELFETFGGVGVEVVQSLRGYARYLCHLDNPEKAQYKPEDVTCLHGSDYLDVIGLPVDNLRCVREMIAWVNATRVYSFAYLLTYAAEERADWFRVLCNSNALVMREFVKSKKWEDDRYMRRDDEPADKNTAGRRARFVDPDGVILGSKDGNDIALEPVIDPSADFDPFDDVPR